MEQQPEPRNGVLPEIYFSLINKKRYVTKCSWALKGFRLTTSQEVPKLNINRGSSKREKLAVVLGKSNTKHYGLTCLSNQRNG